MLHTLLAGTVQLVLQCGVKAVRYKQKYGDAAESDYNFHMQDIKNVSKSLMDT